MTVTHRSLSVATESTFGSLDNSTGLPSLTGLSFLSLPCERDPIVIYGEVVANERIETRDGPHSLPPEPDTVWSGSSRVQRRTGTLAVKIDFTTIGTSGDDYSDTGLGKLLDGGFLNYLPLFTAGDTISSPAVNKFTTANPGDYDEGQMLGFLINGRAEYAGVTSEGRAGVSGDIGLSPKLSGTSYTKAFPMQTWFVATKGDTGTSESSLAFIVEGTGFKTIAYGCVLQSLNISLQGGRVIGDFTYNCAYIHDDHANGQFPTEPDTLSGASQHFRGSYAVISSPVTYSRYDISGTTGAELDRNAVDVETFTFNITNTLAPKAHSNSILGMSGMEISNVEVECSMTLSTVFPSLADDFKDRVVRSVLLGTGPVGEGKGMCLYLPAAYLTVDPNKYDVAGDIVKQTLTYKQTRWGGDLAAANSPSGSPVRIALGV